MSLLTVEERLASLKRTLHSVRGVAGRNRPLDLVSIDRITFMKMIDDLVSLVEDEIFTDDELYLIWQSLSHNDSRHLPVALALAERVQKMGDHRRELGW